MDVTLAVVFIVLLITEAGKIAHLADIIKYRASEAMKIASRYLR